MYHFKSAITHPEKLIADKANYFADIFDFVAADLGKLGTAELETHKSLLEKILTQLDNHTTHSKRYITHYFSNPYLSGKDQLIKEYYSKEWRLINDAKKKYFQDNEPKFLMETIQPFIEKLNDSLFKNVLNEVVTAILCKYPLSKHNHVKIFEYCTPLLVSEFVLAGFNNKDLSELFRRIFERDIQIDGTKVKTLAPLPSELIELKADSAKFFEAASDYLKNRSLKQQFEGIFHLFKNSLKERTIIFPLANISAYKPLTLEHDLAVFSNELRKKYVNRGDRREFTSFFTGRGRMFVSLSVRKGDKPTTLAQAIRNAQIGLNYFNATLKANAQLVTTDCIICDDGNCIRETVSPRVIHDTASKLFNDGKSINYLQGVNSRLARRIISSDVIYFQGLGAHHNEEKLVNLWRYLESFFDETNYKAEDVKKQVGRILSLASLESFAFVNFNLAHHVLYPPYWGLKPESFGVTREELWKLLHPGLVVNSNFKRMAEIIHHPYVSRQLKWQIETTVKRKIAHANNFYSKMLTEAYEQRNLIEHCGSYNEFAVQKVMLSLPDAVAKFRRIVADKAKGGRLKTFHELVENI
ncbi:MAG: hypothetical protein JNK44_10180 [Cyclobacteriaceae bacterium]|nr:hypothetical protein [Cyclobacteriaceae bacterium]